MLGSVGSFHTRKHMKQKQVLTQGRCNFSSLPFVPVFLCSQGLVSACVSSVDRPERLIYTIMLLPNALNFLSC